MELELIRQYHPGGTNGEILCQTAHVAYTIELPWKDNHTGVSCIPEGRYPLSKRYTQRFGWHFLVEDVPARAEILIHPANDALCELEGCIAPVSLITGAGTGAQSRDALARLTVLVYPAFARNEKVFLNIKPCQHEHR